MPEAWGDPPPANDSQSESAYITDPLADLLLSIGAVVILIVIAIFPTLPHSYARSVPSSRDSFSHFIFKFEGHQIDPFIATERGLIVGGPSPRLIPVDRIFLDGSLVAIFERMRDAGENMILLIEPDGLETAFQLEVVASRHGPNRMRAVRLVSNCGIAKSDRRTGDCADPFSSLRVRP